jgi:RNA polymerase sigma factor (sigma-70 family)
MARLRPDSAVECALSPGYRLHMPPTDDDSRSTVLFQQLKESVPGGADYERAASRLVERYTRRLAGFMRKRVKNPSDLDDILLIVLADVIRSIQQFDRQKGRPFTWMCGIARRKIIDFFRSPANHPAGELIDLSAFERSDSRDELAALIERDRWETAEEAVRGVTSGSNWTCYDRVVNGGETDDVVGSALGLPALTCVRYRNRVRVAVEEEFQRLGEEESNH